MQDLIAPLRVHMSMRGVSVTRVGVEPEIDDVPHTESANIGELLFGGLAGCRYPIIETTPVVDRFRIDHRAPFTAENGGSSQRQQR